MINPDDVEFMPLTKGYTAMVDADRFEELSRHKWSVQINTRRAYAVRGGKNGGPRVYMHHQVLGTKPGFTIDHVNSETPFRVLDERRNNLRYATKLQQQFNKRKPNGTSAKYKGVYWNRDIGKWSANIKIDGKTKFLGSFVVQEDAACAYDAMAVRLHGDFARLNFPNRKENNGL